MNPLYYIAANNTNATIGLLGKYNLPAPQTDQELYEAVDYAVQVHGQPFVEDMTLLHPDTEAIMAVNKSYNPIDDAYKTKMGALTADQLNTELASLNTQVSSQQASTDEKLRSELIDKINFITELIKTKKLNSSLTNSPDSIHKTNQQLLLLMTTIVLMFVGSKIFKN